MAVMARADLLVTPDGRYFVVRGRLWRMSNPHLKEVTRRKLVEQLMLARRDIALALRRGDERALAEARRRVQRAKLGLGERGPVWWAPSEGDFNQHLVGNTPYAHWFDELTIAREGGRSRARRVVT
jgi:hypothetical protein